MRALPARYGKLRASVCLVEVIAQQLARGLLAVEIPLSLITRITARDEQVWPPVTLDDAPEHPEGCAFESRASRLHYRTQPVVLCFRVGVHLTPDVRSLCF